MYKGEENMEWYHYAPPIVAVVGLIIYFLEVWLPNFRDKKNDEDLEEIKENAESNKEAVQKVIDTVTSQHNEVVSTIEAINKEAAEDKAKTDIAVENAAKDAKSFLKSEGFDVKEIFPE